MSLSHISRARIALALLALVTVGSARAASPVGAFHLAPVFGHNMVLQQDVSGIEQTEIWGWSPPGLRLQVDLTGQKPITARYDSKTGIWRASWKKLGAGGPFNIEFFNGSARTDANRLGFLTNVAVGEVWVLGSGPTPLATLHPERLSGLVAQMTNRAGGGFRLISASSLGPIISQDADAPSWQVVQPGDFARLQRCSNQAAYLAKALLVRGQTVGYVGIVETAASEASTRAMATPRSFPKKLGGISDAFAANEILPDARRDYLDAVARYRNEVAEFKRVGAVTNQPPPAEIKTPDFLSNALKDFDFTIRGAIW